MGTKLYVGNLPYSCNEDELFQEFSKYGEVESVRIIINRDTGKSKGFAFVQMKEDKDATNAIHNLNGKPFHNRPLTVNEARPREEGMGGGGGGNSRDGRERRRGYDARV